MFLFTFSCSCFIRRDRFSADIVGNVLFGAGNGNSPMRLQPVYLPDAMDPPAADAPRPRQPRGKEHNHWDAVLVRTHPKRF
jgi:hypothetical protein